MRILLCLLFVVGCAAPEQGTDRPAHKGCGCFPPPTVECNGACYGEMVFESFCVSCHRADDCELGPSLDGQFGTVRELEDGRHVVMDEQYILDSLAWPAKEKPVKGIHGDVRMPPFRLSPLMEGVLIEYIESRRAVAGE